MWRPGPRRCGSAQCALSPKVAGGDGDELAAVRVEARSRGSNFRAVVVEQLRRLLRASPARLNVRHVKDSDTLDGLGRVQRGLTRTDEPPRDLVVRAEPHLHSF